MGIKLFVIIIPYEMINRFDSLDIKSVQEFFALQQLYSRLKGGLTSEEEYRTLKKLYLTLKIENLRELNKTVQFSRY